MGDTVVGVDVAEAEFVVACRPEGGRWTTPNDPKGIAATVARLRTLAPALIVAEATGGYERALVSAVAAAGLTSIGIEMFGDNDVKRADSNESAPQLSVLKLE